VTPTLQLACAPGAHRRNLLRLSFVGAIFLMLLVGARVGFGAPGHDHGDAPPAATGAPLPRFAAASELFELVGILDGRRLTVYLDHAATNAPVRHAKVDLELGGTPVPLEPRGDGEFVATLREAPAPGHLAVSATVMAGEDSDLLAGELDLHGTEAPAGAAHGHGRDEWLQWGLGAAAALLLLVIILKRRRHPGSASQGAQA
jgi:hypothetical protein